MSIWFFNTLTRQKEEFIPLKKGHVGLYTCGPTVYANLTIGNYRTYVFADTLRRVLEYYGLKVKQVMNITDVGHLTSDSDEGEDKMEKAAREKGKTAWDIAAEYTSLFQNNLVDLNIEAPHIWAKATDHIKEQIKLIKQLEKKGSTYVISDGVYFDTSTFNEYARLAKLNVAGQKEGIRVGKNSEKRHPTDFALWKFSPKEQKRQMEWKSPWGVGFPGWHIECSAMSMKYLGKTFDIHTGGVDHIPVHHTNEIAQSETATGKPFVRYWLHGEFLLINEARMGKSQGNTVTLEELAKRNFSPLAYRYFLLMAHYRNKLNFTWEALQAAQTGYNRLIDQLSGLSGEPRVGCAEFEQQFMEAVNDDLDTPKALTILQAVLASDYPASAKLATIGKFDRVLGLRLLDSRQAKQAVPPDIRALANSREAARQKQDFALADELRTKIEAAGYSVEDTPLGPLVKKT